MPRGYKSELRGGRGISLTVKSRGYTSNMYGKLFIIFALAVVALAREYPAGLHPAVCPNYPFCDANALARHTPDGIPIPEWGLNPSLYAAAAPVPVAARYPAGLAPALCPNYPYCY